MHMHLFEETPLNYFHPNGLIDVCKQQDTYMAGACMWHTRHRNLWLWSQYTNHSVYKRVYFTYILHLLMISLECITWQFAFTCGLSAFSTQLRTVYYCQFVLCPFNPNSQHIMYALLTLLQW